MLGLQWLSMFGWNSAGQKSLVLCNRRQERAQALQSCASRELQPIIGDDQREGLCNREDIDRILKLDRSACSGRSSTVHGYFSPLYSAMAGLLTRYRGAILVSTMLTNQYPGSCTKPLTESL